MHRAALPPAAAASAATAAQELLDGLRAALGFFGPPRPGSHRALALGRALVQTDVGVNAVVFSRAPLVQ